MERGVAVAALGILDGAEAYLELLGDVSISPAAREIAMLKARLREAEQLMGAAGLARHEVAAMRHAAVCAEARSAALEARLATFEADGRGSRGSRSSRRRGGSRRGPYSRRPGGPARPRAARPDFGRPPRWPRRQ